jgi:hypothetical protein
MAHWAEIDDTNKVIRVLVGDNNDPNGDEGYQWLIDNLGGTWIKTSYNTVGGVHLTGGTPLRKNYAAAGYSYDAERDAFIPPKPFLSWLLDEESCRWEPPVAYPDDGKIYEWDEKNINWEQIDN